MKWIVLLLLFNSDLLAQDRYSILITEIMADPTPSVGLPSNEWIELKNISTTTINLQGWRVGDATSQSGPMPALLLAPDSFIIICNTSSAQIMLQYGRIISVTSFPSLDNDGDQIYLRSSTGAVIHAVEYSKKWYNNIIKSDGGWTLEMIDTHSPCAGSSNWKASQDQIGGTPGRKNSVQAINPDDVAPSLLRTYLRDSISVIAVFNEALDSLPACNISNYTFTNGITALSAQPISPFFREVLLVVNMPLNRGTIYELTVRDVTDCSGNEINIRNTCKAGNPEISDPLDIVINEILFNPHAGSSDFIELFNPSTKVIDASTLFIANRALNGSLNTPYQITNFPFYIFPDDHIVITPDANDISLNYHVRFPDQLLELSLPSLPDDEGYAVLLNTAGTIIDDVFYKDEWHFALINDPSGVSLERIDPRGSSNDPNNWHSASSTAGFATPGYQNSQYRDGEFGDTEISIEHPVISPDNDGINDMITIHYRMNEPGFVANIHIYDMSGSQQCHIIKNQLLGITGTFRWNGLTNNGEPLPVGPYILLTQVFNARSVVKKFKHVIIVAKLD